MRHTKSTHADPTPATDGERVVASFGSQGLHAWSIDGTHLWSVDLGPLDCGPWNSLDLEWGYASSPVIADGKVLVQADVKTDPFLGAFDIETGESIWRVERDDVPTWATPTVVGQGEDAVVLVNGCKHMGAYRLADGSEVWRMAGGGGIPVPAPLAVEGLWIFTSNHRPIVPGHPRSPVFAVKPTARGTLPVPDNTDDTDTAPHIAWMRDRVGTYIQTPVPYRGSLYLCKSSGVVSVLDLRSGEDTGAGQVRLGDGAAGFSASPVAGDGKLYVTSEPGDVYVVDLEGRGFDEPTVSSLGEPCLATPAIAGGMLFFRTQDHVIAIHR